MAKFLLTLFITGQTLRSQAAISNLCTICEEMVPDEYELTIVDVLEQPDLAEEAKILATPTLIKTAPGPVRRIVGDLQDKEQVSLWIGIGPAAQGPAAAQAC